MSQEWMIDVLTDLKNFAQTNGLVALAEQLDDSILVAVSELKSKQQDPVNTRGSLSPDHIFRRTLAAGENA